MVRQWDEKVCVDYLESTEERWKKYKSVEVGIARATKGKTDVKPEDLKGDIKANIRKIKEDYNAAVKDWAEKNKDSFSATFCEECVCEGVSESIKALEAELKAKCGDKKNGKLVECIGSVLNDPKIRPSFR